MSDGCRRLVLGLLIASAVNVLHAQSSDSARTVLAGDPIVGGNRLTPYSAHWKVTYQTPDGQLLPGGARRVTNWFDTVRFETSADRKLLHRHQTLYAPDGTLLETIDNWADASTLAATRTSQSYGTAKPSYRQFGRDSVWGVDIDSTAPGGQRRVSVRLAQPLFDFYGGLFDVFLAALPLRAGSTLRVATNDPTAAQGSGLTWATIKVLQRDSVATESGSIVPTWRIEANAAGNPQVHFVFWIADSAPYLVRMWYVGPRGGKQVWDLVST